MATQNERPTTKASINPRVAAFLAAHGLPLDVINRTNDGEMKLVTINGEKLMWTMHYGWWVVDRLKDWAAELGFEPGGGSYAHEHAFMAGHTQKEFDAWLQAKVITSTNKGEAQ